MKQCNGIFGKYFGHKYRRYLIKERYNNTATFESRNPELTKYYLSLLVDQFEIRCKRCGVKIDD